MKKKYISSIIYSLDHLNPVVSDPRQFWKFFYDTRNIQTWNGAFHLFYSSEIFERFFSQMHLLKSDWQNRFNEENLTHLPGVKVDSPTIEGFHVNYRCIALSLWYNE